MRLPGLVVVSSSLLFSACDGKADGPAVDDSERPRDSESDPLFDDASIALADSEFRNLLLPFDVEVDSANRRVWVTSLFSDVLGEVDLDAGTLLGVYTLPEDEYGLPNVTVDGQGDAWMIGQTALVRVSAGGDIHTIPMDSHVRNVLGAEDGGVFVSADGDSSAETLLQRLDRDGAVVATATIAESVLSFGEGLNGGIATSSVDSDGVATIESWSSDTLELEATCPSTVSASGVYPLETGDFFVLSDLEVGYARCDGSDSVGIPLGQENKSALIEGDSIVVFDRIGDDSTDGPSLGMARRLDADLAVTGTFTTGKHSGFGGPDTTTGRYWLNSEGTSDVLAYDVDAGEQVMAVRLGTHVEGFTVSEELNVGWVTGRLTGLVTRVDFSTGAVLAATEGPMWPVMPVYRDGVVYVLDQIFGIIYTYDAETLALLDEWPLGVDENDDLDFDDMTWCEARSTLLVAVGQSNLLVEIDPLTGGVISRTTLAGMAPPFGSVVGRLEIATSGELAWVVRSSDSAVSRVDLTTRQVTGGVLATSGQVQDAQYEIVPKLTTLTADGTVLYWGHWAFDAATFDPVPGQDLTGTRVVAEVDGTFITWDFVTGDVSAGAPGETPTVVDTLVVAGSRSGAAA